MYNNAHTFNIYDSANDEGNPANVTNSAIKSEKKLKIKTEKITLAIKVANNGWRQCTCEETCVKGFSSNHKTTKLFTTTKKQKNAKTPANNPKASSSAVIKDF